MKKILKLIVKSVLGITLIAAILYGTFHLWEYATGAKYVDFLKANSETVSLETQFTYQLLQKDIEESKLVLVGEIHGFHEPVIFDVDFFKHLHQKHGVRYYVAELDFIQATLLNQFLKNGDQTLLQRILKRWAVVQGRNNQDYFNKYLELQNFYQQLPEGERFQFIGIDQIQDLNLAFDFLKTLANNPEEITADNYTLQSLIDELVESTNNQDTLALLAHLKTNTTYVVEKLDREEIMYQNFYHLFKALDLKEEKLYGFFGLMHVFQYQVNGMHPLASKIRTSDLGLENKILSINFMMNDSEMVMDSRQLPAFMQDEGPYSKMPVSSDNMLFLYMVGIKDFKRMTPNHHKSLVKMNAPNSPYDNSIRLHKTIQLLPFAGELELNDKGKPYVQYTVFVRNSAWAQPM